MRLLLSVALVVALGSSEIDQAQKIARGTDAERARFHRQYLFDLPSPTVTRIEVITEFRRLVLITEDHVRSGDWLFSHSLRSGQEALAPTRGTLTLKAQLRFNPLNTYVLPPPYKLAIGPPSAGSTLVAVDTQVSGQYSPPFKGRDKSLVTSLVGAVLEADLVAAGVGQASRAVGVILEGNEVARAAVDFSHLD